MKQNRARAVQVILFLNLIVFVAWLGAKTETEQEFMFNNFLVSWDALREGRYWTLLTSAFSHNMFLHFFINMYVLNSFGTILEMALGTSTFIILYLVSAITSSLCHAVVSYWILAQPDLPALGASGAVSAVILVFSLLFPKERIYLLGFIPLPAIFGALAFVGLDLWGLYAQAEGGGLPIGHGAHLGGAFTGVVFYFLFLSRLELSFKEPDQR